VLVLGRGSNLVVSSAGFSGVVISLGEAFSSIHIDDDVVEAGSAVPLPRLARATVDTGLTGLEFFVGVPGSVGGAVRQNAGCFGWETKDCLVTAEIVDLETGEVTERSAAELDMTYRHSDVGPRDLVLTATFRAARGDPDRGRQEIRRITRWRRDNQPGGTLNAGSVFKNPKDISAGELIDKLGLKGTKVGDVQVSEKHANFFVAGPKATPEDIRALVGLVKDRVFALSGTNLETEIQFVGFGE
jgi:UDP-N-acetylmuramate dehydrogenase